MKALLYKDMIIMKKELLTTVGIFFIYIPLTLVVKNDYLAAALIGVASGLTAMFPNYSFAYDRQGSWEGYLCATPLKIRTIVLEKFLLLFLALPMLLLALLTVFAFTEVPLSPLNCLSLVFVTLIFGFIQISLFFLLGPNKARILMMLTFLILFYGMATLVLSENLRDFLPAEPVLSAVLGILAAAGFPAAYAISLAAYRSKEF